MEMTTAALQVLRQTKHFVFLGSKRLRHIKYAALTLISQPYSSIIPYRYSDDRYRHSFLTRTVPAPAGGSQLPRRVFVLWTGENELTPNRFRNLRLLRQEIGLPVEFVDSSTLGRWMVEEHPLHPAYKHLSLVHRSDYLRAYLMHHHGGGYCDLKRPLHSWSDAFRRISSDPGIWMSGYPEVNAGGAVRLPGTLGTDISMYHAELTGTSAMIARSGTPLTAEWLREVERRLDYFAPHVAEVPGGVRDEVRGYPIPWSHLLGEILQPLQLKYLTHVRRDESLTLQFVDYQ